MKWKTAEVKSKNPSTGKRETVGTAKYPVYDNLDEALQDRSDTEVLALVNVQAKTNELNKVRQNAVGGSSKKALRNRAMTLLATERVVELTEAAAAGGSAMDDLITRVMDELDAADKAERAAQAFKSTEDEGDEDENEEDLDDD